MKKWLHKFKNWKPIHLCWLFRKLHLAVPRYLIGGGSDFFLQGGRIANATRVWQAAQDIDITNWGKTNDFIVASMFETDSHSATTTFYIHWRNKTDGGSFGMLGSSGELTYNADTDLVNADPVIHSEEGITARYPANHEDGKEIEGTSFRVCILVTEYHEEFHFAVDCSNAHDGDEYEFAIYDSEVAAYVGTLACTITMATVLPIDVGSPAIARPNTSIARTYVLQANPANATGTIDHIEIYAEYGGVAIDFASFYKTDGTTFSTRGYVEGLSASAGYNEFDAPGDFTAFDINEGDWIGFYHPWSDVELEFDTAGFEGIWSSGFVDYIPCTSESGFSAVSGDTASLYATGTEAGGGPSPGWNKLVYASEPPTANAWNQLKQDAGSGWVKLWYDSD